jgi:hypothetical protein
MNWRSPGEQRKPLTGRSTGPGVLDPDEIHGPGVFVRHVVELPPEQAADNGIENR